MRKSYFSLLIALAALTSVAAGNAERPAAAAGGFTYRGTVTHTWTETRSTFG